MGTMGFDENGLPDYETWLKMKEGVGPYAGMKVYSFICNNCGNNFNTAINPQCPQCRSMDVGIDNSPFASQHYFDNR